MKQKIKFLGMFLLVIVMMIVSVVSMSQNVFADKTVKGHKLYNFFGQINGCQAPGTECSYSIEEALQ